MPVAISQRLRCCADMVAPGACVADIGADHGYLGIWLLQSGIAARVAACDLREGPLNSARRNCSRCSLDSRMEFFLSDGLRDVPRERFDTVVCAGMGGDLIIHILSGAPWLRDERYTLILQPQTGADTLRLWLNQQGFYEDRADLAEDGGFIYSIMRFRFGRAEPLSPGERFVSPALLASGSALLGPYLARTAGTLRRIAAGLSRAEAAPDPERLNDYRAALNELEEMEKHYADRQ